MNKKNPDNQIQSFVRELASADLYKRKHAAWMIARLAQKGKIPYIIQAGAIPLLAKCLEDREMIVKYRAVWALGIIAKKGQGRVIKDSNVEPALKAMLGDDTEVEICHAQTGEMVDTTLGSLAEEALKYLV